jgi:hypothetical protein
LQYISQICLHIWQSLDDTILQETGLYLRRSSCKITPQE